MEEVKKWRDGETKRWRDGEKQKRCCLGEMEWVVHHQHDCGGEGGSDGIGRER